MNHDIVLMGASAGGLEALKTIVSELPQDFPAPVVVAMHLGENSRLPQILTSVSPLRADWAKDGEIIEPGKIYVVPRHQDMTLDGDKKVHLDDRPRYIGVGWPSVSTLFLSAAKAFGPPVLGVILTGHLNDGAAGAVEIKQNAGAVIIQDPADAVASDMPVNALNALAEKGLEADYVVPARNIAKHIVSLTKGPL